MKCSEGENFEARCLHDSDALREAFDRHVPFAELADEFDLGELATMRSATVYQSTGSAASRPSWRVG